MNAAASADSPRRGHPLRSGAVAGGLVVGLDIGPHGAASAPRGRLVSVLGLVDMAGAGARRFVVVEFLALVVLAAGP